MPKTKNAFALRGLDSTRILQWRRFKDLGLPVGSDEDVLRIFLNVFKKPVGGVTPSGLLKDWLKVITPNEEGYFAGAIENLEMVKRIEARAEIYEACLERHMKRLSGIQKRFVEKFMANEERYYKDNFNRATVLLNWYREILNSTTILRGNISLRLQMVKETVEQDIRKKFGSRLKQARREAGLTQGKLAELVGLKTFNAIAQYERGVRDPALPTIFRLSTELKCSVDWLLGLS